jgi:hypothetical protein
MSAILESALDDARRADCERHDAEMAAADLALSRVKAQRWHAKNDAAATQLDRQMADCEPQRRMQ